MHYPGGFLLIYFIVYFGLAFVWRSMVVYRATGINPIRLPSSDDAHGYVVSMFKGLLLMCLLVLLAQTFVSNMDFFLPPFGFLVNGFWRALGWVILSVSGLVLLQDLCPDVTACRAVCRRIQ